MGKTYPMVVNLLKREFEEKKVSKYEFCKKTGINPTSVERYLHGLSEPNQASLQKMADYFNVTVRYLRGKGTILDLIKEISEADDLILEAISSLKDKKIKSSKSYLAQLAKGILMLTVSGMDQKDIQETISAVDRLIESIESEDVEQDPEEMKKELRSALKKLNIDVEK